MHLLHSSTIVINARSKMKKVISSPIYDQIFLNAIVKLYNWHCKPGLKSCASQKKGYNLGILMQIPTIRINENSTSSHSYHHGACKEGPAIFTL